MSVLQGHFFWTMPFFISLEISLLTYFHVTFTTNINYARLFFISLFYFFRKETNKNKNCKVFFCTHLELNTIFVLMRNRGRGTGREGRKKLAFWGLLTIGKANHWENFINWGELGNQITWDASRRVVFTYHTTKVLSTKLKKHNLDNKKNFLYETKLKFLTKMENKNQ